MSIIRIEYTVSRICYGIILIGILFKIQHWPYVILVLPLGLITIALLYFLVGLFFKVPDSYPSRFGWLFKGAAIFSAIGFIGILLRIMHIPYGDQVKDFASVGLLFGILGYFSGAIEKGEKTIYIRVFITAMVVCGLCFLAFLQGLFTLLQ